MMRLLTAAVLSVLLALTAQGVAKTENDAVGFDSRSVHDMAELRFDSGDGRDPWVVIKITPAPNSGSATVAGVVIDGATGKTIPQNSTGQTVVIDRGEWSVVRALGPYNGASQGSYRKVENVQTHKRFVDPDDVFSPLARGGVVACRLRAGASAYPFSGPLYLLRPELEGQIETAYEAVHKPKPSDKAVASGEGNVLLSLTSYRAWLQQGASSGAAAVPARWKAVEGAQRSGLVYVLLTTSRTERSQASAATLMELVDQGDQKALHDASLGIFSALVFQSKIGDDTLMRTLIQHIQRASPSSQDPYVRRLLAIRRDEATS